MSLLLMLAVTLPATAPLKVAAPGVSVVNVDAKLGEFVGEHVAQQLKLRGLDVVTNKEIAALLGMERQRQLLGCSEASASCFAELANALGADAVLLGDVARIGARFQVNLKLITATTGKTLALFSETAPSEDALLDVLTAGAARLAAEATGASPPAAAAKAPRVGAWVLVGAGVAVAGAGAVSLAVSEGAYQKLQSGTPGDEGAALRASGPTLGTLGLVGLGVGGAAIVGGLVWLLVPSAPAVALVPTPVGGALVLGGTFP